MRLCACAFVIAALSASSAIAAPSQWFYNRVLIPRGKTVVVPVLNGKKDTVSLHLPKHPTVRKVCTVSGTMAFTNTSRGGMSETRTLAFACPKGTTVTPVLPWFSTLVESEYPLYDRLENIALEYTTHGLDYGVFSGNLEAKVGDVDPLEERKKDEGKYDESDHYMTFLGGLKDGRLRGANGAELSLTGALRLGTTTEAITDESGRFTS